MELWFIVTLSRTISRNAHGNTYVQEKIVTRAPSRAVASLNHLGTTPRSVTFLLLLMPQGEVLLPVMSGDALCSPFTHWRENGDVWQPSESCYAAMING